MADVPKMFFHLFDLNFIYPFPILLDTAPQMSIYEVILSLFAGHVD